ncbi:MAG: HNH endonuclease [Actinomycetota bacterium]|nr:HNH endonuclease [Actinomycetota bacterium]
MLIVLAIFQRTGSVTVSFAEVEVLLRTLIEEYSKTSKGRGRPEFPFHYLQSDGFWRVKGPNGEDSPGGMVSALRDGYVGEFIDEFLVDLRSDPALSGSLVHAILDNNFPKSLHDEILLKVGFDNQDISFETVVTQRISRVREAQFREDVLDAYESKCAFCGYDGRIGGASVGVEAAHLKWHAFGGDANVTNGLALCTMHHKLFDRGAIAVSIEYEIMISPQYSGASEASFQMVTALAGREMSQPKSQYQPPMQKNVEWHLRSVFRAPSTLSNGRKKSRP